MDLLQGLTIAACQGRELDLAPVSSVVDRMVASLERDAGFLHALSHYPEYDFFTFGHSIRVALIAVDVVRRSTDDADLVHRVGCAGLLHDVGKSLVRWDVLHKRGPLDADEKREMQRHSALGAGILLANRTSDPLAVAAAYGHHCDMCGGGYPQTCGEFEQGLVTRLVKICDVYEALTAVRPYKASMTPARAFRTMLGMKGHFDEELLAHFIRSVGVFPAGTRVRLDDGSVGRVVGQTEDLRRPVVDIVEADGGPVTGDERHRIDLSVASSDGPSVVVRRAPAAPVAPPRPRSGRARRRVQGGHGPSVGSHAPRRGAARVHGDGLPPAARVPRHAARGRCRRRPTRAVGPVGAPYRPRARRRGCGRDATADAGSATSCGPFATCTPTSSRRCGRRSSSWPSSAAGGCDGPRA